MQRLLTNVLLCYLVISTAADMLLKEIKSVAMLTSTGLHACASSNPTFSFNKRLNVYASYVCRSLTNNFMINRATEVFLIERRRHFAE